MDLSELEDGRVHFNSEAQINTVNAMFYFILILLTCTVNFVLKFSLGQYLVQGALNGSDFRPFVIAALTR